MLKFPIDIVPKSPDEFQASWADFPNIMSAYGTDPESAFNALIDNSFAIVADLVAQGQSPVPSPAEGRPTVSFSAPGVLTVPHVGRLLGLTRHGTSMATFSWTNDAAYVE